MDILHTFQFYMTVPEYSLILFENMEEKNAATGADPLLLLRSTVAAPRLVVVE
jgi:hypothetical protein